MLQTVVPAPPPGAAVPVLTLGGVDVITRAAAGTMVLGFLPVVPMTLDLGAADGGRVALRRRRSRPGAATLARYF